MIHLFPFDRVAAGSRVILCGNGTTAMQFLAQLEATNYCRVAALALDGHPGYHGVRTVSIDGLCREKFDTLVLALDSREEMEEVRERLLLEGFPEEKLVLPNPHPVLRYEKISRPGSSTMRNSDIMLYIFPFEKVAKGSKVILYGAGDVSRQFLAQLEVVPYCEVAAVADRNRDYRSEAVRLVAPEEIPAMDFDAVLVAINDEAIVEAVEKDLARMGVPAGKILDASWRILPDEGQMFAMLAGGRWRNVEGVLEEELLPEDYAKDPAGFLCTLAEKKWSRSWNEIADLAKRLPGLWERPASRKESITVAIYYPYISNGGAHRVTAMLCNLWANRRKPGGEYAYRVVLVVDDQAGKQWEEYPLDPRVQRACLPPNRESIGKAYRKRYHAWQDTLTRFAVDLVVYAWAYHPAAIWDLLAVKSHPAHPAFLFQSHEPWCLPYRFKDRSALDMLGWYRLLDGCALLSEYDAAFARAFVPLSRYIPNPLPFRPEDCGESGHDPLCLLWVGRLADVQKRPLDAVRMMHRVVKRHPEAVLWMVGDGSPLEKEKLKREISLLGLGKSVVLAGFTLDMEQNYRRASILVHTSLYEAFPLAMSEALAHGIPVVGYELPWLEIARGNAGMRTVPQGRQDLLANEVCALLESPGETRRLGRLGKKRLMEVLSVDLAEEWDSLFRAVLRGREEGGHPSVQGMVLRCLTEYQQSAKEQLAEEFRKEAELVRAEAEQRIEDIRAAVEKEREASRKCKRWTFPEEGFPKGSRILVYGCGEIARDYAWQIKHGSRLLFAGRIDPEGTDVRTDPEVFPLDAVKGLRFDAVLLALADGKEAEKARKALHARGIGESRVYWRDMETGEYWGNRR